jgi:hypothetical protein
MNQRGASVAPPTPCSSGAERVELLLAAGDEHEVVFFVRGEASELRAEA